MSLKVLLMAMSMAAGSTFGIVAQSAAVVDVLKEVKAEYAPDTRVAVWSVIAKTVDGVEVLTGDVDNQSAKSDILARLDKLNIKFEDKIKILPELLRDHGHWCRYLWHVSEVLPRAVLNSHRRR